MKVLVTGSNGFIGQHVARHFQNDLGWQVIGLGRKPGPASSVSEYVSCNLGSNDSKQLLIDSLQNVDAVVHLAADMRREPHNVEVVQANCTGTQRLLEACEEAGTGCFVQLSSLPLIGKPRIFPITEDHPICPPTIYHATKRAEELFADYAMRKHGLRSVSFRITAPVGAGMNPSTIFPVFVKAALESRDIVLAGHGTRRQNYIHVEDISQAIEKAISASSARGVYNLASYNLISNEGLARAIVNRTTSKSTIKFSGQEDPFDDYTWDVSIDRARVDMGYSPSKTIEDCIDSLVMSYQ